MSKSLRILKMIAARAFCWRISIYFKREIVFWLARPAIVLRWQVVFAGFTDSARRRQVKRAQHALVHDQFCRMATLQ